jgi:GDP-L-fucose synthase
MKKIVVTGGTGFLGKNIVDLLKAQNFEVASCSRKEGVDVLNYPVFLDFLKKTNPDIIIHCAAFVGGIAYSRLYPVEIFEQNVNIGINAVKACNECGIKNFINIMPSCTYPGNMDEYEEDKWWDGPMHSSVLVYGMPRKMAWGACFAYTEKNPGFKPIHIIFPNMYGPNDHFDIERSHALGALLSKIVDAKKQNKETVDIWGTGKPIREWLYVEDGAKGILKVVENIGKFDANEIINIGIEKGISIIDLASLIKEIVGWNGNFVLQTEKPDGAMKKILIVKKMKEKLQWEPSTKLEDGIKKTVNWYEEKIRNSK